MQKKIVILQIQFVEKTISMFIYEKQESLETKA